MSSEDTTRNNTPEDSDSASDGDRIGVLGRLTKDQHRDMKLAMAFADFRTNDEFVVAAVVEKTRAVLKKRRAADRAEGRAA